MENKCEQALLALYRNSSHELSPAMIHKLEDQGWIGDDCVGGPRVEGCRRWISLTDEGLQVVSDLTTPMQSVSTS